MTSQDWALMAIAGDGSDSRAVDPIRLMKILFLLQQAVPTDGPGYHFEPYMYGPFTTEVYRDAHALTEDGAVLSSRTPWRSYAEYAPTDAGRERARMGRP